MESEPHLNLLKHFPDPSFALTVKETLGDDSVRPTQGASQPANASYDGAGT